MKKAKPEPPPDGDKVAYYFDPDSGFNPKIMRIRYTNITDKSYTGCRVDFINTTDDGGYGYYLPSRLRKEDVHPTFDQAKACMAAYLTGRLERLKKQLKETRGDIKEITGWEESHSSPRWRIDPLTRSKRR